MECDQVGVVSMSPGSYWLEDMGAARPPKFPSIDRDLTVDVLIIGAGITGLSTAMHLRDKCSVAIVEANSVGSGTSSGSSGHLDMTADENFEELQNDWGPTVANLIVMSNIDGISQVERWSKEFDIYCDFKRVPGCRYSEQPSDSRSIGREFDTALSLGVKAQFGCPNGAQQQLRAAAGITLDNCARFDPLRYVAGLARVLGQSRNVFLFENSRAARPSSTTVEVQGSDGRPHTVYAKHVILATHSPYAGTMSLETRCFPYMSYCLTATVTNPPPDALYWDMADPYHYSRLSNSYRPDTILVGGEDHKVGHGCPTKAMESLENFVRDRFDVVKIERRWSAELWEPADGMPYIGAVPGMSGVYTATGFSGHGLIWSAVASQLLTDLILKRENKLAELFSPSRLNVRRSGATFLKENADVALKFLEGVVTGEKVASLTEIKHGEGKIVRKHITSKPLAVYRDAGGQLHVMSPVCTHLGCIVTWNERESTWDCPCHGGRYSPTGSRLYGPPPRDLQRKVDPADCDW
ncbi:FAD-dependent oxidoreductase [Pelomyxa schiedti]|nr:FAD-dependent oxidoreductase [Pelomyxa schiedti]